MEESKKSRSNVGKIFLKLFIAIIVVALLGLGAGGYTGYAFLQDTPQINADLLKMPQSSKIYDMNNNEIMYLAGSEYREFAHIEDIPLLVQDAFIAVEDVRFREHNGVDLKRIAGAIIANFKDGFGAEGASTITQQVVKNTLLNSEKTIKRKVQEAYLALKFEEEYSKDEILEMYLNKIYFGNGAYGVVAAAEVYFDKPLKQLTVSEAALLAGLPQRPSAYNPFVNPENAEKRRNIVIGLMEKNGFITADQKKKAIAAPVDKLLKKHEPEKRYGAFIDQVIRELKQQGITDAELFNGGMKIYTTLDPQAQEFVENVLSSEEYIQFPDEKLKAGLVLTETQTGEVRAIGGNRETTGDETKRGLNYGTQIKRQPGSTVKPILDYGPGIEYQKWSTYEQFEDEELQIKDKIFKNWDDEYHGSVTMRKALQWSYNIPAIRAFLDVGPERAVEFAKKLGISLDHAYPAYAIGGFSKGISPLELAGAYAAFGNKGIYNKPHTVRKVVYQDQKEKNFVAEPEKVMSEATAYMVTDMLKTVVREGTGVRANIPGLPMAGKTGTTSLPENLTELNIDGSSDAWFAGYTTKYTAAVWTGYDQTTAKYYLNEEKDDFSKELFKIVMSEASKNIETPDFEQPETVVSVTIDSETGQLASSYTPGHRRITELFIKGTEPVTYYKPSFNKKKTKAEKDEKKKKDEKKEKPKDEESEKPKDEDTDAGDSDGATNGEEDGDTTDEPTSEDETNDKEDESETPASGEGTTTTNSTNE